MEINIQGKITVVPMSQKPLAGMAGIDGMKEKILPPYACGMGRRETDEQIKGPYDAGISLELATKICKKTMPEAQHGKTDRRNVSIRLSSWMLFAVKPRRPTTGDSENRIRDEYH